MMSYEQLYFTAVLLLLTHWSEGQPQVVGPPQPVVAVVGEHIILPCHLEPAVDARFMAVEWTRPDLKPRLVLVWRAGQKLNLDDENPSYRGRTSLLTDKLKSGDISLKLSKVKLSDRGKYKCYVPTLNRDSVFELVVGAVLSPVISSVEINKDSGTVVLQCESKGWYPEPELLWLDAEGKILSAGPTETVRGPDDLYTVSSRVTVEKRHSNNITCRVQQRNIHQSKETQIKVKAECYAAATPFYVTSISIILVTALVFICGTIFGLWKWRQNRIKEAKIHHQREAGLREKDQLLAENKKKEEKAKLNEELQKKEEEQKQLEQLVHMLKEQSDKLNKVKEQLLQQNKDMEREHGDFDKKLQSVDKETESDRVKGYLKLKDILLETKRQQWKRKQEHGALEHNTQILLNKTDEVMNEMKEKKREVEKHKVEINEQCKRDKERERNQLEKEEET